MPVPPPRPAKLQPTVCINTSRQVSLYSLSHSAPACLSTRDPAISPSHTVYASSSFYSRAAGHVLSATCSLCSAGCLVLCLIWPKTPSYIQSSAFTARAYEHEYEHGHDDEHRHVDTTEEQEDPQLHSPFLSILLSLDPRAKYVIIWCMVFCKICQ